MTGAGEATLRAYLERAVRLRREAAPGRGPGGAGDPYACLEDFVLREGWPMPWRPRPAGVPPGRPRACFANATRLALGHPGRYRYCEGYAIGCLVPVLHAWVVDDEGFVVDNTRAYEGGGPYHGVPFRPAYLRRIVAGGDRLGLLDRWEERWPLLTGAHPAAAAVLRAADRRRARGG